MEEKNNQQKYALQAKGPLIISDMVPRCLGGTSQ